MLMLRGEDINTADPSSEVQEAAKPLPSGWTWLCVGAKQRTGLEG